jgi:hypothetical protein
MEYKNNWEMTKKRLEAFWEGEIIDRCCIAVESPRRGCTIPVEATYEFKNSLPDDIKLQFWTDGEYILKNQLSKFENTFFGGDAFPQIFINLGAAGHAGFFKGSHHQFENTVWFHPWIHDIEKDKIEFDPNAFLYKKTIELAEYFAQNSKDRYFVSMPDTSGNLDALSNMRGSNNLLLDLYDDRDWVKKSLEIIQKVSFSTMEKVYNIVSPVNEGGSCIGWLNTWTKGKHSQMQCDFSVMISPADFEELAVPELQEQAGWMKKSLYHFDGIEQLRHLDSLLAIKKLDAIQWTCVAGQPSPTEFIPQLRKIQEAGKKLVIPCYDNYKDIEILLQNLSSKGLMILATAASQDKAEEIIRLAERHSHE